MRRIAGWAAAGLAVLAAGGLRAGEEAASAPADGTPETPVAVAPAEPAPAPTPADAANAPQRIVVSATRIETPAVEVPGSLSVVTATEVEERQYRGIDEALKTMPGVSLRHAGGLGGQTSVFVRGLESRHTLVMLDGMPLNDPSSTDGQFDFGMLTFDNFRQTELLRGPQSMLYGSSAMGGVVNITQQRGAGPASGFVSTEGGSRGTGIGRFGAQYGDELLDYSLGGSYWHTDGVSAIDKKYGNTEKDGYDQGNLSLRFGLNPVECLRFDLFANYQKSRTEMDNGAANDPWADPRDQDNPDLEQHMQRLMLRPQATLSLFDDRWVQTAGFGYLDTERKYMDEPQTAFSWLQRNRYEGIAYRFDYQSVVRIHETNTLLAGFDVQTEDMEIQSAYYGAGRTPTYSPDAVTTIGVFAEDRVNLGDVFNAGLGLRNDHHEDFGNHLTWRADALYAFPTHTRLKGSAATGFRAPTLAQLHGDGGSGLANPDLDPETSFGWDAGFEQDLLGERLTFGSSFFQNRLKDMFQTSYSYNPLSGRYEAYTVNAGKGETWGIEAFFRWQLTDTLTFSGQYTYLRTENRETGQEFLRRPKHEATANLDWRFLEKGTLTVGGRFVGRRNDNDFTIQWPNNTAVRMPSYFTARVAAAWKFTEHVEVFGRVENLFDRKYQDICNYGTEGIGFFGGATISF